MYGISLRIKNGVDVADWMTNCKLVVGKCRKLSILVDLYDFGWNLNFDGYKASQMFEFKPKKTIQFYKSWGICTVFNSKMTVNQPFCCKVLKHLNFDNFRVKFYFGKILNHHQQTLHPQKGGKKQEIIG